MPDPQRLLRTLQQAIGAFRQTPGRRGRLIQLEGADEVMVVGDLHGNLANFRSLLGKADLGKQSRRHLILQELIHGEAAGGKKSSLPGSAGKPVTERPENG